MESCMPISPWYCYIHSLWELHVLSDLPLSPTAIYIHWSTCTYTHTGVVITGSIIGTLAFAAAVAGLCVVALLVIYYVRKKRNTKPTITANDEFYNNNVHVMLRSASQSGDMEKGSGIVLESQIDGLQLNSEEQTIWCFFLTVCCLCVSVVVIVVVVILYWWWVVVVVVIFSYYNFWLYNYNVFNCKTPSYIHTDELSRSVHMCIINYAHVFQMKHDVSRPPPHHPSCHSEHG